jgi:hypothetical protein
MSLSIKRERRSLLFTAPGEIPKTADVSEMLRSCNVLCLFLIRKQREHRRIDRPLMGADKIHEQLFVPRQNVFDQAPSAARAEPPFFKPSPGVGVLNGRLAEAPVPAPSAADVKRDAASIRKLSCRTASRPIVGDQPLQWVDIPEAGEVSGTFLEAAPSFHRNFRASLDGRPMCSESSANRPENRIPNPSKSFRLPVKVLSCLRKKDRQKRRAVPPLASNVVMRKVQDFEPA